MKKVFPLAIVLLIILAVLLSACSSDTTYTPPTKVEPTPVGSGGSGAAQSTSQPEQPKVIIFKVGETATDGQLKVTVNAVRFVRVINEKNNEFEVATAPKGQEYSIVDLTVENVLPDKTQTISTLGETTVTDQDGYTYNIDYTALTALSKSFKDGEVLPSMKKRGEVAYLVPQNATNLKFIYKFDLFKGTSAVYDIK